MKTLTIILTDGPYISEYADMAYKIAKAALKEHYVNIFLYLDAVHLPKLGQSPSQFADVGELFQELSKSGAVVRACSVVLQPEAIYLMRMELARIIMKG